MNTPHCCQRKPRASDESRGQQTWMGRVKGVAGLILPGTMLALIPKCPMCLAAYVALGTGFTMSYSSAHLFMRILTVLCIGTLGLCLAKRVLSCWQNKQQLNLQLTQTNS